MYSVSVFVSRNNPNSALRQFTDGHPANEFWSLYQLILFGLKENKTDAEQHNFEKWFRPGGFKEALEIAEKIFKYLVLHQFVAAHEYLDDQTHFFSYRTQTYFNRNIGIGNTHIYLQLAVVMAFGHRCIFNHNSLDENMDLIIKGETRWRPTRPTVGVYHRCQRFGKYYVSICMF